MVSTFILILASVVSIFLAQVFSKISVNYISMIIGALIFFIPIMGKNVMTFNSDIFIGLIVAPLLFFEGQVTRLNAVGKELKHIIQTTVFLVVICMILAGFGVWEIAGVSLPLAFILAAISTPTDATAMESVTNGLKMPKNEGTFLKMESLFNDASGIILLNMAILWYINGYINYGETLGDFFISAGGGVLFSFSAAWIMVLFRQILLRSSYNSLNAQSLIYILTPFVLYYAAEEIHVSGIIAVVCAGLVHNAEAQRSRLINAPQVHLGFDLVSMITEIFNSTFFVILGYMFTKIISEEKFTNASLTWIMIGLTLYLVNVLARYLYGRLRLDFNNKSSWIFALGESVLIILSLIVPTIAFRFLLKKDVTDDDAEKEVDKIRVEMVHRAIDSVNKMYLPDNVKKSVIFDLMAQKQRTRTRAFVKAWVDVVRHPEFTGAEKELEMRAFMNAFVQEREYLDMISQSEIKYQNYVFELYNEILLAETLVIGPTVSEDEE